MIWLMEKVFMLQSKGWSGLCANFKFLPNFQFYFHVSMHKYVLCYVACSLVRDINSYAHNYDQLSIDSQVLMAACRYEGEWLQNQMEGHGVVEVEIPQMEPIPGSK